MRLWGSGMATFALASAVTCPQKLLFLGLLSPGKTYRLRLGVHLKLVILDVVLLAAPPDAVVAVLAVLRDIISTKHLQEGLVISQQGD